MVERIERERGGSMGIVGVIVGALLVIAIAFFLLSGGVSDRGTSSTTINNTAPSAPAITTAPSGAGSSTGAAAPARPAAPAAPAAPSAPAGTTGGGTR